MDELTARGPVTVAFPFVGDLVGGSHLSALGLIRALDPQRYRPLVLLQYPDGAIAQLFRDAGIETEAAPASRSLEHGRRITARTAATMATRSLDLARFLRRRRVGIVHCNDGRTSATWALAARLGGRRLVWHHRGAPDAAGLRIAAPLLAHRIISVSRFAADGRGVLPGPRPEVVHSPFDTVQVHDREAARSALLEAVPAGRSTRFLAFSGAFIDRKRPLLFVEVIAALRRKVPALDVRGIMLGEPLDGMDAQVRELATRTGVADAVHLLGFRSPGAFWLAACDMLVVPAVGEPFGRTIIEAMLVGTPVVATRSGGNVEAIRDGVTGVLAPPDDAEGLADACLALLDDPARAGALRDAAQEEARRRFGVAQHATAVMAIYDDLMGRARSRTGGTNSNPWP